MSESIGKILDHCIEEMEKGRTAEECLETYPQWRDELAPLLQLVGRLRTAPKVQPSASFRRNAAIRMKNLIAAGNVAPAKSPDSSHVISTGWRVLPGLPGLEKRLAIPLVLIALLMASIIAGGGTAYASQDALPGDLLYGVKMVVEDTRLLLNTDEIGDAELHLEFATERLEEAATLVAQGKADLVESLMDQYVQEMEAALAPVADGVDEGNEGEVSLQERLEQSGGRNLQVLEQVYQKVPEAAKRGIERAMEVSRRSEHTPGPPPHAQEQGPPPHAQGQGPPPHAQGHGPPDHAGPSEDGQALAGEDWGAIARLKQLRQYVRRERAEHAWPPGHAQEQGPPDHAGEQGPPDHAGEQGPPDHAQGHGPPDHAQDGEPGPPEVPPGQIDKDKPEEPPGQLDKDKSKSKESKR